MKKSIKEQTAKAFQTGGMVYNPQTGTYTMPGTGISGFQPAQPTNTGYTSYTGTQPYMQPLQYTGTQFTTAEQTTNIPTFGQMVGSGYQGRELRTYVNDAGQVLQIPFVDGKPVYPIPDGYKPKTDQPQQETQTTVTPTTGQTQRDEGGGRDDFDVPSTSITGKGIFSGTTFKSPTSANQAVTNEYGITGNRGVNLATIASIATGNVLGAIGSVSGYGPLAGETMAFGNAPTVGMLGSMSKSELEAVAKGFSLEGFGVPAMSQEQAQNALDAAAVLGVDVTQMGHFGYQPGDAVPGMPGAFMDANGIARDVKTGAIARGKSGAVYSDIKSMVARFRMTDEEKEAADTAANQAAVDAAMSKSAAAKRDVRYRSAEERAADKAARDAKAAQAQADYQRSQTFDASPPSPPSDSGKDDNMADRGGGSDVGGGQNADGSVGGGAVGGGCFEKGTLFKMADGTTKCVEDIKPGDKMYKGGLVYAVMQGDGLLEDWYDYNGIHVTSAHPVLDNGTWKRVGETSSKKAIDKREVYYSLMNTNHLMIAENGTEFTDFVEISADIGGRGEWMMEMLNQRQAA